MTFEAQQILLRVEIRIAEMYADALVAEAVRFGLGEQVDLLEPFSSRDLVAAWRLIQLVREYGGRVAR